MGVMSVDEPRGWILSCPCFIGFWQGQDEKIKVSEKKVAGVVNVDILESQIAAYDVEMM
jgi:hypothetical protein